jgi:cell shape-determining protein MreC
MLKKELIQENENLKKRIKDLLSALDETRLELKEAKEYKDLLKSNFLKSAGRVR